MKVLEPFEIATVVFSKETNISLSTVLPIVQRKMAIDENDSPVIKQFKTKAVDAIVRRWELETFLPGEISILATVLDPRFKQLSFLTDEQKGEIKATLLLHQPVHSEDIEATSQKRAKTAFDILLGEEIDSNSSSSNGFKAQITHFLGEKPIPIEESPLEWRKNNASRFLIWHS